MTTPEPEMRLVPVVHELKCWPEAFDARRAGRKPWELRLNDRDYSVGDTLRQRRWCPIRQAYTGEVDDHVVTWALYGPAFGLPEGYVIMSLAAAPAQSNPVADSEGRNPVVNALASHPETEGLEGESVALMRPFWVSWWGLPGTFELHRPWWVSGERDDGLMAICAAVLAPDEFTARLSVQWAHDDKDAVFEWRFVEERPKGWSPFSDRFRRADWMIWPETALPTPPASGREGEAG